MQKTLLIVDDDPNLLKSLVRVFRDEDYQILTASSGEEALDILDKQSVQVILSDQRMPNMSGSELLAAVKKLHPETVRLVLSGYADFDAVRDAINEGSIYKFLSKPWSNDELHETIKDAFIIYDKQQKSHIMAVGVDTEVSRLKTEFLENLSHEIRTPLNGIIGFAEILYNDVIDVRSPEHKEYLGDILNSSRTLNDILKNMMEFMDAESEKMQFEVEKFDIITAVKEVEDVLKDNLESKKASIVIHDESNKQPVFIDKNKLKQVLYHYLTNAIKFSHEGDVISINIRMNDADHFYIEVKDNGVGIREEDIIKLFKPFTQLEPQITKRHQGTGLGLALVQRMVELQGGHVGVASIYGKGSTFFVILPIHTEVDPITHHIKKSEMHH